MSKLKSRGQCHMKSINNYLSFCWLCLMQVLTYIPQASGRGSVPCTRGSVPCTLGSYDRLSVILMVIIHSFYIVLFSAVEQTNCTHWHVILNEWLYPFIVHIINIHGRGVLTALCGCCMAGATWNAVVLAQVLCTPFNHAPGYSVTSFKAT